MLKKLFLSLALLALPAMALAQTPTIEPVYSALSVKRLSIAAGVDQAWYARNTLSPVSNEFKYGIFGAYVMGRNLSAVGGIKFGSSRNELEEYLGLRLMVFQGNK